MMGHAMAQAALARLGGRRFAVIGRGGMDLYADPPGTPIEQASSFAAALGGSAANIAVGLVRQGCAATLVTVLPDDPVGGFVLHQLGQYGIDSANLRLAGGQVRASLAVVETRAEHTRATIYRNGAADLDLTPADVERLDMDVLSGLILTGTGLSGQPSRDAMFHAIALARAAGVPVILDLDYRPYGWPSGAEAAQVLARAAQGSDIVIGNDVEFDVLAGAGGQGAKAARDLAHGGARIVVYKQGGDGALTHGGGQTLRSGVFAVQALKPTGAGDAFMAGFVAALAAGQGLAGAVRRGSGMAALVVTQVGCAPAMPDTATLDTFLAAHPDQPPMHEEPDAHSAP